ncbi:MAG TPA: hypothetical protein PK544_08635 [Spirochaetota bacterium]|nr:hypothetical protein [Spirochaetota bacterium]HPJ37407.1 hypothetical protein [Spirochaetota bacterium]HPQ53801.1 hypothetical protein [Spirochaetota bacterium]
MNGDILLQNLINIFIISIILEAAVMAVFSVSALRGMSTNRAVESTRDIIILLVAFFLCFKVQDLRIFVRTGLDIPKMLDIVISSLVLTRMTMFVRTILSRMKGEE